MRLGLLRLGRGYSMDDASLDEAQRATLSDMATLGLVYRPPENRKLYYATPLSQHLLSGGGGGGGTAASSSAEPSGDSSLAAGSGFLILETNFRLYAYSASKVWAKVCAPAPDAPLAAFVHVHAMSYNMYMYMWTLLSRRSYVVGGGACLHPRPRLNSSPRSLALHFTPSSIHALLHSRPPPRRWKTGGRHG